MLPACTPPGPIDERLLGWAIALAVCVPAALFFLPPRHHGELRRHAADAVAALADRLEGKASRDAVVTTMLALRESFLGADFRPVGLSAGSRALVRVVEDLEWLADRVSDEAGASLRDMQAPGVRVLRCSAAVLRETRSADRTTDRANLEAALIHLRSVARGRYRQDVERDPRRTRRRGGRRDRAPTAESAHHRGDHRGDRPGDRGSGGRRRAAGVGEGARAADCPRRPQRTG